MRWKKYPKPKPKISAIKVARRYNRNKPRKCKSHRDKHRQILKWIARLSTADLPFATWIEMTTPTDTVVHLPNQGLFY